METNGIVYVLINPSMPGLVKIGKTTQADVTSRMNQLYTTGVPVPFECVYAIEVEDCSKVESAIHTAFVPSRINLKREFFKIDSEQAIAILKILEQKEVTPQIKAALDSNVSQAEKDSGEKLKKRPKMNFSKMGIPSNSELVFIKDGEKKVIVKDEVNVIYNGKIMTLTRATKIIMKIDYSVQPSLYWTFEGKLLKDIYDEIYDDEENS